MSIVQSYLLTHSLEDLEREHGVESRVHQHKVSLNYSNLTSRPDDPLARQCRGLVLSTTDGSLFPETGKVGPTLVLARPFDRFFNYGEPWADHVDVATSTIWEKLDGTLCLAHFDPFAETCWRVATRSVPEADLRVNGWPITFAELFINTFSELVGQPWLKYTEKNFDRRCTYLFELTGPLNHVIVQYTEPRVWLLGVRENESGKEWPETRWPDLPKPVRYRVDKLDDLIQFVSALKPNEQEGVVVCDAGFHRIKVKSPAYFLAHETVDFCASSPRNLMRVALQGQADDAFPLLAVSLQEALQDLQTKLANWVRHTDEGVAQAKRETRWTVDAPRAQRKQFALYCQTHGIELAPSMQIYSGRAKNTQEWLRQVEPHDSFLDKLAQTIGWNPALHTGKISV